MLTPNLSLDKHATSLSAKCFFQLRQLCRIGHSFDDDSIATLVHVFVAPAVSVSSKKTTDKLQRVLNAAIYASRFEPVPAPHSTLDQCFSVTKCTSVVVAAGCLSELTSTSTMLEDARSVMPEPSAWSRGTLFLTLKKT